MGIYRQKHLGDWELAASVAAGMQDRLLPKVLPFARLAMRTISTDCKSGRLFILSEIDSMTMSAPTPE
jgi:hypothetical protein